jgi:hypothetical protein
MDFRHRLGNAFDQARAVLRMAHSHADAKGFDFHAGNLTTDGPPMHMDFLEAGRGSGEPNQCSMTR